LALELDLLEVVAVDDVEAAGLAEVRLQDRLRLAAELVAAGEDAAHVGRGVGHLARRRSA
jgi:hypothetical protein